MDPLRTLAIAMMLPFAALTAYALYDVGYVGIPMFQMQSSAGWQVLVDLVIALVLILAWLVPNARETGRNPWPYVLVTLAAGSFGPLLYLALRPRPDTGPA